jgi:hypothetical protein
MQKFTVIYQEEIEAISPEQAAQKAMWMISFPEIFGLPFFTVRDSDGGLHEIENVDLNRKEHDPDLCGCEYKGNNMWSCGHIDGEDIDDR